LADCSSRSKRRLQDVVNRPYLPEKIPWPLVQNA
jgi:hypothetical protein